MEREESEGAQYSELLTTTLMDTPVKSEDDATAEGTGASLDGEGLSVAMPWVCAGEKAYCLLGASDSQRGLSVHVWM